jgi:hypothetical protein
MELLGKSNHYHSYSHMSQKSIYIFKNLLRVKLHRNNDITRYKRFENILSILHDFNRDVFIDIRRYLKEQ